MHENGVLRGPGRHRAIESPQEEPLALAVVTVEGHLVDAEGAQRVARLQLLFRPQRRRHDEPAGRLQQVVALRGVGRIWQPPLGDVGFGFRETAATGIIALHVDIGQTETGRVAARRGLTLDHREVLQEKTVHRQRARRPIDNLNILAECRQVVVERYAHLHADALRRAGAPQLESDLRPGGVGRVERPAHAPPGHLARQLADLKTGEPERAAHGAKAVQPGWQQVAALVLPLQSAKGIGPPVEPQGALAAHGTQHAFAGHAVEQRRSGQRRDYAELPRYHTVGQHESFPVRRAIDGGTRAPGLEQPVVGRAC